MDNDFVFMSRFSGLFVQIWAPLAALRLLLGACSGLTWRGSHISQKLHMS